MTRHPAGNSVAQGLDIGSNTFSFCELKAGEDGVPRVVADASVPVRLSEGLVPQGRLRPAAIARGLAVLESYKEQFALDPTRLRAVATAVLRLCAHPEDFTKPAQELLGVPLDIVSGDEEARLTYQGATLGLPAAPRSPWIMVDIGGQSTELGWLDATNELRSFSLPLGVVALTETFLRSDPPAPAEVEAARRAIRAALATAVPTEQEGSLMCVAGTATTLGALALALTSWDRSRLHGLGLSAGDLDHWTARILGHTTAERTSLFGISVGRADVFPAGLMLFQEVLCHLKKSRFTISANGLRVGVALGLLA